MKRPGQTFWSRSYSRQGRPTYIWSGAADAKWGLLLILPPAKCLSRENFLRSREKYLVFGCCKRSFDFQVSTITVLLIRFLNHLKQII